MRTEEFLLELLKIRKDGDRRNICTFCADAFGRIPGLYLTDKAYGCSRSEYSMVFTWPGQGEREPVILHGWIDDIPAPKKRMHTPRDEGTWGIPQDFAPVAVSGNLYGNGAVMGKGGAAVLYGLMTFLSENDIHYPYDIKLLLTIGHRENAAGLQELLARTDARAALLIEPTAGKIAAYSAKAMWMDYHFDGTACHASAIKDKVGKDGKVSMYELLDTLAALYADFKAETKDTCSIPSSFNLGRFASGRWVSSGAVADVRIAVFAEASARTDFLKENMIKAAAEKGGICTMALERNGVARKSLDPIFAGLVSSAKAHGLSGEVHGMPGVSDLEFFEPRGIPAACFGTADPALAGTTEEHISKVALNDASAVIKDWLDTM